MMHSYVAYMCLPRHNSDVFLDCFQTVVLAHMVLTVRPAVIHVSIEFVTDLTESVDMVVSQALKEIVVT